MSLQSHFLPARWLSGYERSWLRDDLVAGFTTAVMLVPQGMAYAMLAGLPPIYGLYASLVPLVVYALFGTSRQLAVGPVAMVSLMVAGALGDRFEPGGADWIGAAIVLAFLVGAIQFGMGVLRLGSVTKWLSHPVVSGFTSAAALIIGLSQLGNLLGLSIPRGNVLDTLIAAVSNLGDVTLPTVALSLFSVATLLILKRRAPRIPGALLVVVVTTVAAWGLGLASHGVRTVGDVPGGLPGFTVPAFSSAGPLSLVPTALAIAFVGFMESVSVARAFARRKGYEIDPNRELIGLGGANLVGAFFGAYPTTGGFSRTAVNAQAGARTPLASLITAGGVAITLVALTPLFASLPKATLAAIVMVAVFGLIDLAEPRHLWHHDRRSLVVLLVTFLATLTIGIEPGIAAGVVLDLVSGAIAKRRGAGDDDTPESVERTERAAPSSETESEFSSVALAPAAVATGSSD